jgi:PilZ domain
MTNSDFGARPPRVAAMHDAVLIDSDGGQLAVVITDISARGFRLRTSETLMIGEKVTLRVEKYGDFPAQIRWALGHQAGGAFLEPATLA